MSDQRNAHPHHSGNGGVPSAAAADSYLHGWGFRRPLAKVAILVDEASLSFNPIGRLGFRYVGMVMHEKERFGVLGLVDNPGQGRLLYCPANPPHPADSNGRIFTRWNPLPVTPEHLRGGWIAFMVNVGVLFALVDEQQKLIPSIVSQGSRKLRRSYRWWAYRLSDLMPPSETSTAHLEIRGGSPKGRLNKLWEGTLSTSASEDGTTLVALTTVPKPKSST